MRPFQILLGIAVVALSAAAIAYLTIRSGEFIEPIGYEVKNGRVIANRLTPFGPVWARWYDKVIYIPETGSPEFICEQSGETRYDATLNPRISVPLNAWFGPEHCDVSRPGLYHVVSEWRVILASDLPVLGDIVLRPVSHPWEFEIGG